MKKTKKLSKEAIRSQARRIAKKYFQTVALRDYTIAHSAKMRLQEALEQYDEEFAEKNGMAQRLCTSGWLKAYREYTAQSESPEPYHLWVALSTLSGAIRRHVWIDQGHYRIFPNLYVVLVSPPGTCKKSSAMNMGLKLLRKVPDINIEPNQMTPQSLITTLSGGMLEVVKNGKKEGEEDKDTDPAKAPASGIVLKQADCTATLASTEFSVMLGSDSLQNGMLSLLTDLYDSPDYWAKKTLQRKTEELHNVFLSIIAATTPDWLGTSIPMDAIGGGFTSRILFVSQSQRRKDNPRPKRTEREKEVEAALATDLIAISKLKGEMKLDAGAEAYYDHWYRNRDRKTLDERFWGYLERKPDHLLKIAILLSVSISDDLIITENHLQIANAMLEALEARMPEAFRGVGPTAKDIERIASQLLEANNVMTWSELVAKNIRHLSKHDLGIVVETMSAANIVEDKMVNGTRFVRLLIGQKRSATP